MNHPSQRLTDPLQKDERPETYLKNKPHTKKVCSWNDNL